MDSYGAMANRVRCSSVTVVSVNATSRSSSRDGVFRLSLAEAADQ